MFWIQVAEWGIVEKDSITERIGISEEFSEIPQITEGKRIQLIEISGEGETLRNFEWYHGKRNCL